MIAPAWLISLGLKLSPVGRFLAPIGRFIWGLLTKRIPVPLGILLAFVIWTHFATGNKVEAAFNAGRADGVAVTTKAFNDAQAKADARQRAKVDGKVTKATAISQESNHALVATNDAIDARAHKLSLRHDAAIRQRDAQPRHLPAPGAVAAGACEAPAQDGLPWSVALPLMTQAAKDLAQLNAILDHEEAQQALAAQ